MKREVILDTNILVAALRSRRGASHELVRLIGQGEWRVNISVALALEYEDVLKRPNMLRGFSVQDVDDFIDYILSASNLVAFVPRRRPRLQDPNDEQILELAVRSQAMIVTHNTKDFAGAERLGVVVRTPAEFLVMLRLDQ
ncbi:MAG TPA: putative toxin-antitoxin system toxin component, PIN family [Bryobacteraceae bacterium]|nr:putative toxin-antitoxin system toxin component, PIN family [Bryobacteraceae bacterium]